MPPLQYQRKYLRDELTQPPPALSRSTSTYHHKARVEPQPKPTPLSPQQGAARRGTTPEEATREQSKWLATDEVEWRKYEGERWRGKRRTNREQEEEVDASPMPEHDAIRQLAHELETPKKAHGDWAEEVERDLGCSTQGEYKPTSYS